MKPTFLSLLLLAGAARAQTWTSADLSGAFDDDNPGAVANMAFGDQLQNRGFHQICDKIPLSAQYSDNQGLSRSQQQGDTGLIAGGSGGASRSFYRYPTGTLALVDEVNADVSLSWAQKLMRPLAAGAPLMLVFSSESQGRSTVVRPLGEATNTCQELRKLVNLKTFKTAVPLTAKRIAGMEVGELWKFPASFKIGVGPQAGAYPAGPALNGGFFIAFTHSRSRGEIATLYRLSQDVVRFRVRIDRAQAFTLSGEAIGSPLPLMTLWQGDTENGVKKFLGPLAGVVSGAMFDALNSYLTAVFNVAGSRGGSDQVVLEYLLNPNDPAQMQGLEQALKGDLAAISPIALAKDLKPGSREKSVREFLDGLSEINDSRIGAAPNFAGADRKDDQKSRHIHLRIPAIVDYDHTRSSGRDQIVSKDLRAGEIDVRSAGRSSSRGGLDIPGIKGHLERLQGQRTVQSVSMVDGSKTASSPMIVYVQQEGFLRGSPGRVSQVQSGIGGVMAALAGGSAPPAAVPAPAKGHYTGAETLTVVLSRKAVADILSASAEQVKVALEQSLAGQAVDPESLADRAAALVSDLAAARSAQGEDARGQALVKLLSGQSAARLAYEAAMKVVLRLADPTDVAAEYLSIVKGPGASSQRYQYNAPAFQDPDLKRFSQANRRFMQPLPLSD